MKLEARATDLRAPSGAHATAVGLHCTEGSTVAQHEGRDQPWHALTWTVWAIAAAACVELAASPVYVLLVVGIAAGVAGRFGGDGPLARAFPTLLLLAVAFAIVRVVLSAATTHGGPHVLFTTPSVGLPDWLGGFTLGGTIEAPVVFQAASEALVVVGILAVFGAFNAVVSHHELVQAAPRAFHELGLVVVVALAFVPSTIAAVHDVAEADRARTGGRSRRRGRIVRRLVPVLETGLERAVTLAESMDSRGFAAGGARRRDVTAAWCGLGALVALGGSFVALVGRETTLAAVLIVVGLGVLAVALAVAAGGARRVRYRPRKLRPADGAGAALALLAPAMLAVLSLTGDASLTWAPSPLRWPALHVLPLLALVPLGAPFTAGVLTGHLAPPSRVAPVGWARPEPA